MLKSYFNIPWLHFLFITEFSPPNEFCERLSVKLNREVQPDEISNALLLEMLARFSNKNMMNGQDTPA
jgi:hypothetical protein